MRVKTQNINLEGFDRIQEIVMRLKLAERTLPPGDITIKLNQDIIDGYCDYSWYGGLIAEVYSMDSEYRVMANGDVIVNLIDKKTNDEVAYVKEHLSQIAPSLTWEDVEKQMKKDPAFAETVKEIKTNINSKR